ncbi:MAG: hypothetical protein MJ197_08685 [Bacteroidales bacterium]|nr:hypothetical protein [Bacteroidales bacterium]
MNCDYCTTNGDYTLACRMLKESRKREEIARNVINDLRKKMIDEEVVKKVLDAHAKVLKKAPKGNIIELIVEELKK